MCGICGQFNFTGKPVERETVVAMMHAIRHRGPDSHGLYVNGPIGLGHQRLSIIDLSEAGHQPMAGPDGKSWIVFNGEIYNYAALKRELETQGERFVSTSDTEVLLRLYLRMGPACLAKLEGMFAFAIWNEADCTLFLARDRVGIKPLYYYRDSRTLVLGSEIKAILECEAVPRKVNPEAVITYFSFGHSFAPDTIYQGIRKLPPAHWLLATSDAVRVDQYWDVPEQQAAGRLDERECAAEVARLLEQAVTSHMVSDVPVGAFLSGGIDSSAVVAFMAKASSQPVKTFSIGFDVGGHFNETDDARRVARQFKTDHYEKTVRDVDVEPMIERLAYHYDEPFADAACLPTYIVSELAREHVKVVLSGEGGDEVFGGYRRYYAHLVSRRYQRLPHFLRETILRNAAHKMPTLPTMAGNEFTRRLRKSVDTMGLSEEDKRYGTWLAFFSEDLKSELFDGVVRNALAHFDGYGPYRDYYNRHPQWDTVNRMLYTDLKGWLPDTYLEKIDKAAMAVSLEGRVPFLDHRLIEFVFALPGNLKVRRRTTKYLLKKSLEGILTRDTLYKPKHGFAVPLDHWFRGRLHGFAQDVLLGSGARGSHYFRRSFVEKMLAQHDRGERNYGIHLWTLINFELWHRRFMSGERVAAEA